MKNPVNPESVRNHVFAAHSPREVGSCAEMRVAGPAARGANLFLNQL